LLRRVICHLDRNTPEYHHNLILRLSDGS
jgi:hypothetical protein